MVWCRNHKFGNWYRTSFLISQPSFRGNVSQMLSLKLLKGRGLLQNSLSYKAGIVILACHDQTKVLPPKPDNFWRFGARPFSFF